MSFDHDSIFLDKSQSDDITKNNEIIINEEIAPKVSKTRSTHTKTEFNTEIQNLVN
jgi:hypothetical protein